MSWTPLFDLFLFFGLQIVNLRYCFRTTHIRAQAHTHARECACSHTRSSKYTREVGSAGSGGGGGGGVTRKCTVHVKRVFFKKKRFSHSNVLIEKLNRLCSCIVTHKEGTFSAWKQFSTKPCSGNSVKRLRYPFLSRAMQLCRLICSYAGWVFAGCTCDLVGFAVLWLICDFDILRAQYYIFMNVKQYFTIKQLFVQFLCFFSFPGPLGGVWSGSTQSDKSLLYPPNADHYYCLN